jgi:hypothetical protein
VFLNLLLWFGDSVVIWFRNVDKEFIGGVTISLSLSCGFIVCFDVRVCGSYVFVFWFLICFGFLSYLAICRGFEI